MAQQATDEQTAICEALRHDGPSIMAKAYAGTGKSSTIRMAAPGWKSNGIALGFNKATAEELTRILPDRFTCKSFNGLGHGVVARATGKRLTLDDRKIGKLTNEVAKSAHVDLSEDEWVAVRNTVSKAMLAGVTPDDEGDPLVSESPELWQDLAADAGADEEALQQIADLAREVLVRDIEATRQGVICFDDQVYYSAVLAPQSAWTRYPLVIGDEWQDANALNHRQVSRLMGSASRVLFAGDPLQSIYAFRGSLPDSMEQSRGLRGGWTDLPLTMTFRCPKVVVQRQQHYAKGYRAHHDNAEGEWKRLGDPDTGEWKAADIGSMAGLAILCRNNAPLLRMGFKLIRQGQGVQMLGRDLGKGLRVIVDKVSKKCDTLPITEFIHMLERWAEHECIVAQAAGREKVVERVQDQVECLLVSAAASEAKDTGMLKKALEKLFEQKGLVTLSSIHQAKGKEWDTVVHLDPWRIPSKFAKIEGGVALKQEKNALYVLETRTKRRLLEANSEDFVS